jgi:hypothetical protein
MYRLKVQEAETLLEPPLTKAMAIHGYTPIGLKSEPLTYTKPASDGLSNIVCFTRNGWDTPTLYLALGIGVNEPRIAKQLMRACRLGGNSHTALVLCGTAVYEDQSQDDPDHTRKLTIWNLAPKSDFDAIALEAAQAADEHVRRELAICQTMSGLHHVLKHFRDYPTIRQFDDKQMQYLIPIVEHAMGNTELAKRTITQNIESLRRAEWLMPNEIEDYVSELRYIIDA